MDGPDYPHRGTFTSGIEKLWTLIYSPVFTYEVIQMATSSKHRNVAGVGGKSVPKANPNYPTVAGGHGNAQPANVGGHGNEQKSGTANRR